MRLTLHHLAAVPRRLSTEARFAVGGLSVVAAAGAGAFPPLDGFAVVAAALGALLAGRPAGLLAALAAGIAAYLVRAPHGWSTALVASVAIALAAACTAYLIGAFETNDRDRLLLEVADGSDTDDPAAAEVSLAELEAARNELIFGMGELLGSMSDEAEHLDELVAHGPEENLPAADTIATIHASIEELSADVRWLNVTSEKIGRSIDEITLSVAANLESITHLSSHSGDEHPQNIAVLQDQLRHYTNADETLTDAYTDATEPDELAERTEPEDSPTQ